MWYIQNMIYNIFTYDIFRIAHNNVSSISSIGAPLLPRSSEFLEVYRREQGNSSSNPRTFSARLFVCLLVYCLGVHLYHKQCKTEQNLYLPARQLAASHGSFQPSRTACATRNERDRPVEFPLKDHDGLFSLFSVRQMQPRWRGGSILSSTGLKAQERRCFSATCAEPQSSEQHKPSPLPSVTPDGRQRGTEFAVFTWQTSLKQSATLLVRSCLIGFFVCFFLNVPK